MKLLLLDQFSDLGGAQQVLLEFLPVVRERGWKAVVGLPGEGEVFARVREWGFDTVRIPCGPYRSGRKSLTDAARFLIGTPLLAAQLWRLAQAADLVYVNGPRLLPGVALARVKAPVLFHAHSFLFPGKQRQAVGESLRKTRAWVIGSCEHVAAIWRPYADGRVSVIYNGVAGPEAAVWKPSGVVGCVGRIAPEKGQLEFLRAAAMIHRVVPACRFQIYGAALFEDRQSLRYAEDVRAAAAGLPVTFAGWISDVYNALAQLSLLLVPSAGHEATTRVILEAFAAGVPVIAFRSGGIPEVIEDGRTGFLVDSADEMAQVAIELMSGGNERLRAISAAARDAWQARFTIERYHRDLLGQIETLSRVSVKSQTAP